MLWSCEGLIRLAMVLRHLNAILTFVFLNMFVTLRICGVMLANVTNLLFLFMIVCVVVCFVISFIRLLRFVLSWVGKRFAGPCEELLNILFFGLQHRVVGLTFFCAMPINYQFVFTTVGECKMYGVVCCCKFSVNICF